MFTPDLIAADALRLARTALAEDGDRDITSEVCVAPEQIGSVSIEAREGCVLAGRGYADAVVRKRSKVGEEALRICLLDYLLVGQWDGGSVGTDDDVDVLEFSNSFQVASFHESTNDARRATK